MLLALRSPAFTLLPRPPQMDKKGVSVERVQNEMAAQGVVPMEWGGDTPFVPISAKFGTGVETLLEEVVLMADA